METAIFVCRLESCVRPLRLCPANAELGGANEVGRNQWDRTRVVSGLPRQFTAPPHRPLILDKDILVREDEQQGHHHPILST